MIIRLIRDFFGGAFEYMSGATRQTNYSENTPTIPIVNVAFSHPSNSNNSPSPVFAFERSYLKDFSDNREPLIYLDGKLYVLGKKTDNLQEGIIYQNRCRKLEELEDIMIMENQIIKNNQEKIQSFQKEALSFYAKRQNLKNLENFEMSSNHSSLDSFILNYLIPAHTKKINEPKNNVPIKIETDKIKFKQINFPKGLSVLEMLIRKSSTSNDNSRGVALIDGDVYLIQKGANLDKSRKYKKAEEFESEYLNDLSSEINSFINNDISSCLKQIGKSLPPKKEILREVPSSVNGLYFQKNSEKEYIAYIDTGEYTMGYKGNFYHFDSTRVGVTLSFSNNHITFTERPFIYNHREYNHPLVYGISKTKEICLGAANSPSYRKTKWGITSNTDSPIELARGILETLRRGRNIITSGCTNDNFNSTYSNVEDCGKKISRETAQTMESTGVPIFYGG